MFIFPIPGRNGNTVDFGHLLFDVGRGHPPAVHADDGVLQLVRHAAVLRDDARLEAAVAVAGDAQRKVADALGLHGLGRGAVAGVAAVVALDAVLLVAQVLVQLGLKDGFDALLEQALEEALKLFFVLELLEKILWKDGLFNFFFHGVNVLMVKVFCLHFCHTKKISLHKIL